MQDEWKIAELSAKSMGKGLNKVFKVVVNEFKKSFLIKENQDQKCHTFSRTFVFAEDTRLPSYVEKAWLKATLK